MRVVRHPRAARPQQGDRLEGLALGFESRRARRSQASKFFDLEDYPVCSPQSGQHPRVNEVVSSDFEVDPGP